MAFMHRHAIHYFSIDPCLAFLFLFFVLNMQWPWQKGLLPQNDSTKSELPSSHRLAEPSPAFFPNPHQTATPGHDNDGVRALYPSYYYSLSRHPTLASQQAITDAYYGAGTPYPSRYNIHDEERANGRSRLQDSDDDRTVTGFYANKNMSRPELKDQMKSQRRRYPWQTTATRRHWLPPYRPWFSYLSSLAMVLALAASLLRNRTMTGNLLEISPFNIMLGPSTEALIQTGARYLPCLYGMQEHSEQAYICPDQIDQGQTGPSIPSWRLAVTNQTTAATCNLQDVCGSGTSTAQQAYRFFTAPFLHAGILHCFLVFTVQLGLGRRVERQLGPLRYGFVWLVCAFFSYLVSAVFSPTQTATMGASGALFGIVALLYVDLLTHWWRIPEAAWEFCKLLTLTVIGLISGYLPGLDNFVHIGGFVAGILLGLVVMLDMSPRRRQETTTVAARLARWAFRIVVIALFAVACGLTLNAFYQGKQEVCSVCMYLACLPVGNMCQAAGVALP